ncbi:hypothetical protein OTU49_002230, partial [Cherax quadricarinatus]
HGVNNSSDTRQKCEGGCQLAGSDLELAESDLELAGSTWSWLGQTWSWMGQTWSWLGQTWSWLGQTWGWLGQPGAGWVRPGADWVRSVVSSAFFSQSRLCVLVYLLFIIKTTYLTFSSNSNSEGRCIKHKESSSCDNV